METILALIVTTHRKIESKITEKKRIALINQDLFFLRWGGLLPEQNGGKVYMSHIRCCRPFFVVCVVYGELVSLRQNGYDIYTIEDCQDMSHFSDTQVYRRQMYSSSSFFLFLSLSGAISAVRIHKNANICSFVCLRGSKGNYDNPKKGAKFT